MKNGRMALIVIALLVLGGYALVRVAGESSLLSQFTGGPAKQSANSPLPVPSSPLPTPSASDSPLLFSEMDETGLRGLLSFNSTQNGHLQVYELDLETKDLGLLTRPIESFEATWSPDCQSVIYVTNPTKQTMSELYLMDKGDQEAIPLFSEQDEDTDNWYPAWSPTADVIAYQTNDNPEKIFQICFASLEGEKLGCMDETLGTAQPAWSPDGSQLAYISSIDGDWEIYVADIEIGAESVEIGEPSQLTINNGVDMRPKFSPDGQHIAFDSRRDIDFNVYRMTADGQDEKVLTASGPDDTGPTWIGNDYIMFASQDEFTEETQLYLMDTDGNTILQMTDYVGRNDLPNWCDPQ